MKRRTVLTGLTTALVVAAITAVALLRDKPITVEAFQGEWYQDPDFLQHSGADLDAQRREIDQWENYEFRITGTQLKGWRMYFEDGVKDLTGWAQGKGRTFDSAFTLEPAGKETALRFDERGKPIEARLSWSGADLMATIGDRKMRLKRGEASKLRLVAGK